MANGSNRKISCHDYPDSQNLISFQEYKGGNISKKNDKAVVTIDLRYPRLVHLFCSENDNVAWKAQKSSSIGETSSLKKEASLCSYPRPQTARRGGCFHQHSTRHYSKSGSNYNEGRSIPKVPCMQGNSSNSSAVVFDSAQSCAILSDTLCDVTSHPVNTINPSIGQSDIIDVSSLSLLGCFDLNSMSLPEAVGNDTNGLKPVSAGVSDQPSTIIHLKVISPSCARKENDVGISDDLSFPCTSSKSGIVCPPDSNVDCEAKKRKQDMIEGSRNSTEGSSLYDSEDDDLPLIVHCKRRNNGSSINEEADMSNLKHGVKRTYERGNLTQNFTSGYAGPSEDLHRTEKPSLDHEALVSGDKVTGESCKTFCCASASAKQRGNEFDKKLFRLKPAVGSESLQKQTLLEEYERSRQVLRNAAGGKLILPKRSKPSAKSSSDSESPKKVHSRRSVSLNKKHCVLSSQKSCLTRVLAPGPISVKRRQMKQLKINPRIMSHMLKELTERKCVSGRFLMSFFCISHQNYYDGSHVVRLAKNPPAKEKVTVHIPIKCRDDLEPIGKEVLKLWKLSNSEVVELQKQIKQEMEHKRTEHIMPVVLQMSYEQIESAYEQVKRDMKTYEITENDTDLEEDEEEEEEEEEEKEQVDETGKTVTEELENEGDENVHVTSYEIIVHDESSKTISCETVEYLEYRNKHSALENGTSEKSANHQTQNKKTTATDSEAEDHKSVGSPCRPSEEVVEQTSYSRSRPKRHAVDYSPNAFAPIRLMEGKRLAGHKVTPVKPSKKPTDKKPHVTCREKKSMAGSGSESSEPCMHLDEREDGTKCENGSSGNVPDVADKKSETEDVQVPGLPNSPELPSEDVTTPVCSVLNETHLTDEGTFPSKGNNNFSDNLCDDDVPVILDVSEMHLSQVMDFPPTFEKFSTDQLGDDVPEKLPSSYELVRKEYIRLRGLTQTEIASDSRTSEVQDSGTNETVGDLAFQMCSKDSKLGQVKLNADPSSKGRNQDSLNGAEILGSDMKDSQKVFSTTGIIQGAKDGRSLANMPRLHLQSSDNWEVEAENLLPPPDLGLPIEDPDSLPNPSSPVQPPALQVEEEIPEVEKGSISVKHSFVSVDEMNNPDFLKASQIPFSKSITDS